MSISRPRTTNPKSALPNNAMRILLFILGEADKEKCVTYRQIAKQFGWVTPRYVMQLLEQLKSAGLITWQPKQARTIRPTCRFTLHKKGD